MNDSDLQSRRETVDARFTLAAERTMLAWLRTSLGLIGGGVAVLHVIDPFGNPHTRLVIGAALVLVGGFAALTGIWRWRRVQKVLADGGEMPGPWEAVIITLVIVAVALAFVVFSP
ncbi:YidH family protein [Gordonia sp. (in: high G+C Gram-positive bacteria)]|uniref:YidH family protein n=1 Tax=Gordonia sp. (in: high G+C Gram-positive bacteria) TaxID=84139 RepID=UPI0039E64577